MYSVTVGLTLTCVWSVAVVVDMVSSDDAQGKSLKVVKVPQDECNCEVKFDIVKRETRRIANGQGLASQPNRSVQTFSTPLGSVWLGSSSAVWLHWFGSVKLALHLGGVSHIFGNVGEGKLD